MSCIKLSQTADIAEHKYCTRILHLRLFCSAALKAGFRFLFVPMVAPFYQHLRACTAGSVECTSTNSPTSPFSFSATAVFIIPFDGNSLQCFQCVSQSRYQALTLTVVYQTFTKCKQIRKQVSFMKSWLSMNASWMIVLLQPPDVACAWLSEHIALKKTE